MDSSNEKTDVSLKRCRTKLQLFAQRWCSRRCLLVLLLVALASAVVCIGRIQDGAKFESLALSAAPPYVEHTNDKVCGMKDPKDHNSRAETFETPEDAKTANVAIVHCVNCGHCSTAQDMKALVKQYHPHQGPEKPSSTCAWAALLLGQSTWCAAEPRGLSAGCHDCHAAHAACVYDHCKYTCIKQSWFPASDAAYACDDCRETMCHTQFLQCSGATRKRMGIVSGHGSSASTNQCNKVNYDWMRGVHFKTRPTTRRLGDGATHNSDSGLLSRLLAALY